MPRRKKELPSIRVVETHKEGVTEQDFLNAAWRVQAIIREHFEKIEREERSTT